MPSSLKWSIAAAAKVRQCKADTRHMLLILSLNPHAAAALFTHHRFICCCLSGAATAAPEIAAGGHETSVFRLLL